MRDAGFSFTYRATSGSQVFTGKVENGNIEVVKVKSAEQSRQEIKQMFKGNNK